MSVQEQVFIKTLTRRGTRVNDPLASQGGQGTAGYSGGSSTTLGQSVAGPENNIALIDLADGPTRRIFSNKSTTVVVLPDLSATLQASGSVTPATTASGLVWRAPRNCQVWGVVAMVGGKPAGGLGVKFDVKSVATPTAAGTSIFVDSSRIPVIGTAADYSPLGAFGAGSANAWMGNPGGSALMAAGAPQPNKFGTAELGKGTAGLAVIQGSALGMGSVTPLNTFIMPAGSFLRVEIAQNGTATTIYGTALAVQIFAV